MGDEKHGTKTEYLDQDLIDGHACMHECFGDLSKPGVTMQEWGAYTFFV